jgi:hypothetical protein
MKVCILDKYHHKNQYFLEQLIEHYFERVNTIADADVVLSAHTPVNIQNFPEKGFIFGPHFSVFPDKKVKSIHNVHDNAIYIQPSEPSRLTWLNEYKFNTMPIKTMSFGVNTKKFCPDPDIERDLVILYHKNRDPHDLHYAKEFLKYKGIDYMTFDYKKRYAENDYLAALKRAKYAIWVGAHESQGFALEEALSCNVPLLVWSVTKRVQEWSHRNKYRHVKSAVTSIPYWSPLCGEFFLNEEDLEPTYDKFIEKLSRNEYNPRKFIEETLSIEVRSKEWANLINSFEIVELDDSN